MDRKALLFSFIAAAVLSGCHKPKEPATSPGAQTSAKTDVLKAGAAELQGNGPLNGFNVYLDGFHPMKQDPAHQVEAHHFCKQVNEDFAQCVVFDGNTSAANMTGIEYIISDRVFNTIPPGERKYWHPHNYEILSGQLIAPGLLAPAEKELMKSKMNSYGKTWHFWATDKGDKVPAGEPMLAWSFNHDGEADPGLVAKRDQSLKVDTAEVRRSRQDLVPLAKPQEGADDLKGKFGRPTTDIPGVTAK